MKEGGGNPMARPILVVDDEPANRELLEEILSAQGYEVAGAADGQSALAEFARLQPDLVLLDVMMPDPDGLEVCRRLKSDPNTRLTPVVLVTSLTDAEDRLRGIEAGADDFLNKPIDRSELLARVRSLLKLKIYTDELERAESVLFTLARIIEARDMTTVGHCARVSENAARLAERIGLGQADVTMLRRASLVHDIGKIAVPDFVLTKPGPLTPEERYFIDQHPVMGERICAPLKSFREFLPVIRHHHEKLDGTGFPDHLRGEEVPLGARITQIADVYDALTSTRYYRSALPHAEALQIMESEVARGWWDPFLFAEFKQMLGDDPAQVPV
jgi:cyclic di-GMP phosphodiesterase